MGWSEVEVNSSVLAPFCSQPPSFLLGLGAPNLEEKASPGVSIITNAVFKVSKALS